MMKNKHSVVAGILLCLMGILAVPVAAFTFNGQKTPSDNSPNDPGMKDELWAIHADHRLERYNSNIQAAGKVIATLNSHGYNTAGVKPLPASFLILRLLSPNNCSSVAFCNKK
jgi:hypothetical protein